VARDRGRAGLNEHSTNHKARTFILRSPARLLSAIAAVALAGATLVASAQTYPNRPPRLIVPFPAGGSTDLLARAVGQRLGDALGQQIVVDNRPGANTIVAYEATLNAPADGYTMLMEGFNGLVLNPNMYRKLPYDADKDFVGVALIATSGFIVVVNPKVPVNSMKELVEHARKNAGKVNLASAGIGNSTHVAAEMFLAVASLKMNHVPYKGSAAALPELVNGTVDLMFDTPITSMPFVRAGKLRGLAVSGDKRLAAMPDLPTIAELGYPGFNAGTYYNVTVRRGTPQPIIDRLSAELVKIAESAQLREMFQPQGIDMAPAPHARIDKMLRDDRARFAKVIKDAGIVIEQ